MIVFDTLPFLIALWGVLSVTSDTPNGSFPLVPLKMGLKVKIKLRTTSGCVLDGSVTGKFGF